MRGFLLLLALIATGLAVWAWQNREYDLVALFGLCAATPLLGLTFTSRRRR
jgi:hypothetical protein